MKNLTLVLLLSIVSACSTSNKREVVVPVGEPKWLYAPSLGCSESDLCASAQGKSFDAADINSKKNLASIFSTKIDSTLNISTSNFSSTEKIEMEEEVNSKVGESVNEVLKGVVIHERFKKDESFFALAKINKKQTASFFKTEIMKIDNEIDHFLNLKNRIYVRKLIVLWNRREYLNEKLRIVANAIPGRVTFSEIISLKYKASAGSSLFFEIDPSVPDVLGKKIGEVFTDIGYKLVKKNKADYFLNLSLEDKEQYLNVSGFKKYTFTLSVLARGLKGKKLGSHTVALESSGRTKNDAFLKIRPKLINTIKNNMDKLNLK